MSLETVHRHKTAMQRSELSRPVRIALEDGLLRPHDTVLDYGCGRGGDVDRLNAMGYEVRGWDPVQRTDPPRDAAKVVNLGYVINVIEDPLERVAALESAWSLTKDVLIVSARLMDERSQLGTVIPLSDGVLTSLKTFQKFYLQSELRKWIDEHLGLNSIAAAPGVFYAFKSQERASDFAASRFRTRISRPIRLSAPDILAAHPHHFESLLKALENHGREPVIEDMPDGAEIAETFGGMRRAVAAALASIPSDRWEAIRATRRDDLLVYLALGRFEGRVPYKALPSSTQRDVRAHFGSHGEAMRIADQTLLAIGRSDVIETAVGLSACGKILPTAFYVHASALPRVPLVLRLYEGCARALAGTIEGANIVKMSRRERRISYLSYPSFDDEPHPELRESTRVDLQTFDVRTRRYCDSANPPVLHRKETFVAEDHPQRPKYARLTAAEERAGLLESTSTIGTRDGWMMALREAGLTLHGHTLRRSRPKL